MLYSPVDVMRASLLCDVAPCRRRGSAEAAGSRSDERNQQRRDCAAAAVGVYACRVPEHGWRPVQLKDADGTAEAISELLCDLRHLGDEFGLAWEELCARAGRYYSEEREGHAVEVTCEGFQIRALADDRLRADVWASRADADEACAELNERGRARPDAG